MASGFVVKIFQPTAHFRVPFTYSRRHTYPLPPYSTVIGMLANLLNIRSQEDPLFRDILGLRLSVAGSFQTRITEYVWLRNLARNAHITRFGSVHRRSFQGLPEHPGGQIPVRLDVLENVTLWLVFAHENEEFLHNLQRAFQHPRPRDVLHLGRAEDWIILEETGEVQPIADLVEVDRFGGYVPWFHWIPEPKALWIPEEMDFDVNETSWAAMGGLRQRITTLYQVVDGRRVFHTVEVKLVEGNWPPGTPRLLLKGTEIPVWFWRVPPDVRRIHEPGDGA